MRAIRALSVSVVTALLAAFLVVGYAGAIAPAAAADPLPGDPLTGTGVVSRTVKTSAQLNATANPGALVDPMAGFGVPANAAPALTQFNRTLRINNVNTASTTGYSSLCSGASPGCTGGFDYFGTLGSSWSRYLPYSASTGTSPNINYYLTQSFVTHGSHLIPTTRGLTQFGSLDYNIIWGVGRVWSETTDTISGNAASRASIPFTLIFSEENCSFYGTMTFLYTASATSRVHYQVASETCSYFKGNLWGNLATQNVAGDVNATTAENIRAAYNEEVANRMPTKPISELAVDYPGFDLSALTAGTTPAQTTAYGFVYKGVNYTSDCVTRTTNNLTSMNGIHPFCDQVHLPSYSTAKSIFMGGALMRLAEKYPADNVYDLVVKSYVSDSQLPTSWTTNGVRFKHLIDMASGYYDSTGNQVDEGNTRMINFFSISNRNRTSMMTQAGGFPFKEAPGQRWVYHTSDSFILSAAMNTFLKGKEGTSADIYSMLYNDVLVPIGVNADSSVSERTKTTQTGNVKDAQGVPWGGFGLWWNRDSLAKIGDFFNNSDGKINGVQVLEPTQLNAALQRDPSDRGLATAGDPFMYNNGFWAREFTTADNAAFTTPFYVPFMSGFGGITVVMMPNCTTFWRVSDNAEYTWASIVSESQKIDSMMSPTDPACGGEEEPGVITPGEVSISGTPAVGQTLTAVPGTWDPVDVDLAYEWQRNGSPISGAESATYVAVAADAGATITVKVTGTKDGHTDADATSGGVVIQPGTITPGTVSISGTPEVGQTLTAVPGSWTPGDVDLAYEWLRDDTTISGANSATYLVDAADAGTQITVKVTGSKTGYTTADATSTGVDVPAAPGTITPGSVSITGTPEVGQTLTAVPGTWDPNDVDLAYQWLRDGVEIDGATGTTYAVVAGDLGGEITVKVTGSKTGYTTADATSSGVTVLAGTITPGAVSITGTPQLGQTLTAVPGSWTPGDVTLSYQWLRDGVEIDGATSSTYALVAADSETQVSVKVTGSKTGYTSADATGAAVDILPGVITPGSVSITGTPAIGETLTAVPGSWTPGDVDLAYQWLRNDVPISGATNATYDVDVDDAGTTIKVKVTGSKTGHTTADATSAGVDVPLGTIIPGAVSITGTPQVGNTLTAVPGSWTPGDVALSYQWLRDGVEIDGADGTTYAIVAGDAGGEITVKVTGSKTGYTTADATSDGVTVLPGTITPGSVSITGTPQVGNTLTAVAGSWTPGDVDLAYQWLLDGVEIDGATGATYAVVAGDAGGEITVKVTGSKTGYTSADATSSGVTVLAGTITPGSPSITGTPQVGQTLTAVPGTWDPVDVDLAYQWQLDGVDIDGATGTTYAVVAGDAGGSITVKVTGSKTGYTTADATSSGVDVLPGVITPGSVSITGTPAVGETLTAVAGSWTPGDVSLSYQWLRDGVDIDGATAGTYEVDAADAGTTLTVKVTGSKTGYTSADATSTGVSVPPVVVDTCVLTPGAGPTFTDVPGSHQFKTEIQWLADVEVSTGWVTPSGAQFRPSVSVSRDAMAAFLYRFACSPEFTPPVSSPFKDVKTSHQFYPHISWLADEGISTGWAVSGGQEFRPSVSVSRDAMAAFMYRFAGEPEFTPPVTSPFLDVPTSHQFYTQITWLASTGISTGWVVTGGAEYRPSVSVSRDAMAAFLYRLNNYLTD